MSESNVILKVENIHVRFGDLKALNGVNMEITSGKKYAIIGPNGAGKTTLINVLTGFISPNEGKILYRGVNITSFPSFKHARMGIARTFQIGSLFEGLTVAQNIEVACQAIHGGVKMLSSASSPEIKKRVQEILNFVGLENEKESLAKNISYGSRRNLEIGIALAANPKILLLDEPFTGLVREMKAKVIDLIEEVSKKMTVIIVDHDLDSVANTSDIVIVLNDGKVIGKGTMNEIQKLETIKRAYLGG